MKEKLYNVYKIEAFMFELLGTAAIGSAIAGLVSLVAPLAGVMVGYKASRQSQKRSRTVATVKITFKDSSGKSHIVELNADAEGYKVEEAKVKELLYVLEGGEHGQKVSS